MAVVMELLASAFIYSLTSGTPAELFLTAYRPFTSIVYNAGYAAAVPVVIAWNNKTGGRRLAWITALQLALLLSETAVCWLVLYSNPQQAFDNMVFYYVALSVPIVLMNMVAVGAVEALGNIRQKEQEMALLEQQNRNEFAYYQLALENEEKLRGMRHDLANNIQTIQALAQEGQIQESQQLARSLLDAYPSPIRHCGNGVINIILSLKEREMRKEGIQGEFQVADVPQTLPISDLELSSVLSNLLDNAIRGSRSCPEPKVITVQVGVRQGYFIIRVSNPFVPENLAPGLVTTKQDKDRHGMGLRLVRRTAEQAGGTLLLEHTDGQFTATATFKTAS